MSASGDIGFMRGDDDLDEIFAHVKAQALLILPAKHSLPSGVLPLRERPRLSKNTA
jgi:hypothetical protein